MSISKDKFEATIRKYIKREGIEDLIKHLANSDFYTAPASRFYHSSHKGGLMEHSYNVFTELWKEVKNLDYDYDIETVAIVGLFHDLCKIGYYGTEMRNTKENGKWVKKPYYTIEDSLPFGHGEKSVFMIREFIKLNMEEIMAIRWHMCGFEPKEQYNVMSKAMSEFPLIILTHSADLKATYILEGR